MTDKIWPTNEAMAEKIADLEGQIESLCVALKLSQCRVKDLEKRVEKLEAVRRAAEELTGCCIHACEPRTLDKIGELQQALQEAK